MKVKSESKVAQSCPTLSDPMDGSPPGSSIRGIFQAKVLEWGAIAFSFLPNTKNVSPLGGGREDAFHSREEFSQKAFFSLFPFNFLD